MNILVISQYYYPEDFRINDICEELVRRGNKVTVVAGIPNYPEGVVYKGYEKSYKQPEYINGVKVIRCNNRPRKNGILNLLLNYRSYYKKASVIINKLDEKFDIVYGYQMSPIMQMIPAIKYKKKHNVPFFMYVCDLWPESMRELGNKEISKKNIFYKYFLRMSRKVYSFADMIGTKCEEFIDYLEATCGIDRNKCKVIYEHAESNYLAVNEKPTDNGIIDFMYLGNIGHSSNCSLIVKATSKLSGKNFKVHFVGDGSELTNLKTLTEQMGLEDNIVFHGRKPQKDIIDYYNLCDVCLLTLSNTSIIGVTPPAKLTGYMAACRPIIASVDGAAKRIINAAGCGYVVDANDVDKFAEIMQNAIDNYNEFCCLGIKGRKYFLDHFTIKTHIDNLSIVLGSIIKKNTIDL